MPHGPCSYSILSANTRAPAASSQHQGTHCFQPFINHHSDLTSGAHLDMEKAGLGATCLSEVGWGRGYQWFSNRVSQSLRGPPQRWAGCVCLPDCGKNWDTFHGGQISTEERAGIGRGTGVGGKERMGKNECWEIEAHPTAEKDRRGWDSG